MPDEVRKLDNKKCIIFIRGFDPIMDNKYVPFSHPMFNQTADGKGKAYVHPVKGDSPLTGQPFEILSEKAVKHYEKLKESGGNVYIDSLSYDTFMMLGEPELKRRITSIDEAEQKAKVDEEQANELEYSDDSQNPGTAEDDTAERVSDGAPDKHFRRRTEKSRKKAETGVGGYHYKPYAALVIYSGAERGSEESTCGRRSEKNDTFVFLSVCCC